MNKESDLETKYQRLATEYSKVRSQATVLKKAVLDEQTKNGELIEHLKNVQQTLRKRDQEIESLSFRNGQLTKRIMVLQQELLLNNSKKGKSKLADVSLNTDITILHEELQKKIMENAQLYNSIADKDTEIRENNDKLRNLEDMVTNLQMELETREKSHQEDHKSLSKEDLSTNVACGKKSTTDNQSDQEILWKNEVDRWKTECNFLKSKPSSNLKLTQYYESQFIKILQKNVMLQSETKTIWSENMCLKTRLENILQDHNKMKNNLENNCEELMTTNNNYKSQLDALTEHLAAQNEKITRQCDEIQILKHKLALKN